MKIQGDYRFAAPRQEVWKALLDPDVLSRTVPGSSGLEKTGENEFKGELKMKVGPVQGVFQGKVTLENLDPPRGYTLRIDGRGAPGFVNGSGAIVLEDDPGGGTVLRYDVDAQVGGRIAAVGQRLLESSGKVITRQALEALDAQIRARGTSGGSSSPRSGGGAGGAGGGEGAESNPTSVAVHDAPPPPSTTKFAAGVVKGVIVDMVPPQHRKKAGLLGLFAAGLALVFGLRGLRHRFTRRRERARYGR